MLKIWSQEATCFSFGIFLGLLFVSKAQLDLRDGRATMDHFPCGGVRAEAGVSLHSESSESLACPHVELCGGKLCGAHAVFVLACPSQSKASWRQPSLGKSPMACGRPGWPQAGSGEQGLWAFPAYCFLQTERQGSKQARGAGYSEDE